MIFGKTEIPCNNANLIVIRALQTTLERLRYPGFGVRVRVA
jgi:hypothetical protein